MLRELRALSPLDRARLGSTLLLLVAAYLFGGTSGDFPGRVMLIELIAIGSLALTLTTWKGARPSWGAIVGITFLLGLPLLQLIPLPPNIWQLLPGREVAREIAAFVDPGMWRPITLDANATFKAWLSLLLPVAMFLAVLQLPHSQRVLLCLALIGIAVTSLLLGLLQLSIGATWLFLFDSGQNNLPVGFFTNRNHQAALFYVAAAMALFAAARSRGGTPFVRMLCAGLVIAFAAGIFATESRAGMALLGIILALSIPLFFGDRIDWRMMLGGIALLAVIGFLLSQSGVVRDAIGRFALLSSEGRFEFWPEAWYAAQAYFPIGAGMGTFVKSYQAMETLDALGPAYVNHAHNDYLELVLEFGALAFAGMALFAAWYGHRWVRALFLDPRDEANLLARIAMIAILALLLHSIVDYPVRTYAHLTLFGMLCALAYRPLVEGFRSPAARPASDPGARNSTPMAVASGLNSTDRTSLTIATRA